MQRISDNRQLGNKGFTLVELIVAMTISLIIIGAAGAILISSTNLFAHQASKVEREAVADTVADFARSRLTYAQSVEVVYTLDGVDTEGTAILYIGDAETGAASGTGNLYFKRAEDTSAPINVYGTGFYKRTTIGLDYTVTATSETQKSFAVTIKIYAAGNDAVQYEITKTYKFANSALDESLINVGSEQSSVQPFYLLIK
jgi:prepilin-type N-terminal cleavage/methylation domain-containing protein